MTQAHSSQFCVERAVMHDRFHIIRVEFNGKFYIFGANKLSNSGKDSM